SIIVKEGEKAKLTLPTTYKSITWKSSNKKIVTVTKNGTISAKNGGKATIAATSGKKTFKCIISVKENYANWIPYSTSSLKTLAQNIKNGHVVMINGQYYCSPEYAEEVAKAREEAENELANPYDTTTLSPDSEYIIEEEDDKDSDAALKDRIKNILKNETPEEELFLKEWINEVELLKTYGIDVDGGMGNKKITFIKDNIELFVIETEGLYSSEHVYTYENMRYQYIYPDYRTKKNQFYFNKADLIAKGIITE
ncbi:MAG: hypothetical protein K0S04_1507, partial [Herbinix sp.]|nr:hypothetical protein [Herbinix sp.]